MRLEVEQAPATGGLPASRPSPKSRPMCVPRPRTPIPRPAGLGTRHGARGSQRQDPSHSRPHGLGCRMPPSSPPCHLIHSPRQVNRPRAAKAASPSHSPIRPSASSPIQSPTCTLPPPVPRPFDRETCAANSRGTQTGPKSGPNRLISSTVSHQRSARQKPAREPV